jgi:phosphatidylserine synthase
MFILGILMVSRIRFPKATIRESKVINAFQIINIALIFVCGVFRIYPEYLFGIGVFLLVAGTIAGRITRDQAVNV